MNLRFACFIVFSFIAVVLATDPASPQCSVSNVTISLVTPGIGLTLADIQTHLNKQPFTFQDPLDSSFSCVDGRSLSPIIGTPGGDSGEFLLALTIYNKYVHPLTTDEQVLDIFKTFIETEHTHRSFYMHTDQHALDHLTTDFAILNPGVSFKVNNVPAAYQPQVLKLVTDPNNIGCGHLRSVLTHPDQYEVNVNLTSSFIRTFFTYLWNHGSWDDLKFHNENFTVLTGNHQEKAVVNVIGVVDPSDPCADYVPAVVPDNDASDIFVNHPAAVTNFRTELANFFSTLPDAPNAIVFKNYMDNLASKQLTLTLGYLAAGLPVYQVNISYAAVTTPVTTGVTAVTGQVKGNAGAAISLTIIGIFLVLVGSVASYFGYQKYYAPAPVVKKPAKKPVEEKSRDHEQVELQELEEEKPERGTVQLEDV